jgi:lipoprotein-releasing system permease protein
MFLEWLIAGRYIRGVVPAALFSAKSRISFTVMVVAIALLVIVLSVFNGFQVQMKKAIWAQGSHISLIPIGDGIHKDHPKTIQRILDLPFYDKSASLGKGQFFPGDSGLPDQPPAAEQGQDTAADSPSDAPTDKPIRLADKVTGIHGAISSPGLFVQGAEFTPIEIRAVDYQTDENGFPSTSFPRLVHYDRDLLNGMNGKNIVIVGEEFSRFYGPVVGQYVRLYVPRGGKAKKGGEFSVGLFRIAATFKTNFYETDSSVIYMPLKTGQRFYSMPGVNKINIQVRNVQDLKRIRRSIAREIHGFRIDDVESRQRNLLAALQLEKTLISIILFLFVVLAAVGMVATIFSQIRSKRQSLGILKALGLSNNSILVIFTINGLLLGILASIAGGIFGIFIAFILEDIVDAVQFTINAVGHFIQGYAWNPVELIPRTIYYFDSLPVTIDISLILLVTLAATILSGLAGYIPARQAARLEPVETIRYE